MISYAQNLEDVVLNRVFQNKPNGFYIDVGAHDPIELSVTKHFYDLGWHGVNIEPVPASHEKFKKGRPDDINLNIAVGSKHDFTTIYEIEGHPELTSLDKDIAESTGKLMDAKVKPYKVEIRTLTEICEQYCNGFIDFIKIDVEGFEKEVILGTDLKRFRPTMLVVEATKPCKAVIECWDNPDAAAAWHEWEPLLFEVEYILTYYDGLNRYYVRKEDEYLKNRFAIPVTWIQDQFSLYRDVRETWRLDAENKQLEKEKGDFANQFDALARERSELLKERDQLKNKETELVSENEALSVARVQLVEENGELNRQILELNGAAAALEDQNSKLVFKVDELAQKKKELENHLQATNLTFHSLQSENSELHKVLGNSRDCFIQLLADMQIPLCYCEDIIKTLNLLATIQLEDSDTNWFSPRHRTAQDMARFGICFENDLKSLKENFDGLKGKIAEARNWSARNKASLSEIEKDKLATSCTMPCKMKIIGPHSEDSAALPLSLDNSSGFHFLWDKRSNSKKISSSTESPLVSVVTVVLNADKLIEKTIKSVVEQSYSNIEYIVIDGNSTDKTLDIIHRFKNKIDAAISEPDEGIYDAMNKGIDLSSGEWTIFLNAGDTFYDAHTIETVFNDDKSEFDIIYGDTYLLKDDGSLILEKCGDMKEMWKYNPFYHQSVICKTLLLKADNFNRHYKIVSDSEFIYKQYIANKSFLRLDIPISICLDGGLSRTEEPLLWIERWKMALELKQKDQNKINEFYFQILSKKIAQNKEAHLKNHMADFFCWHHYPLSELENYSKRPVFIVGSPRSGTTLMRYIVDAHPKIFCPHLETFLFDSMYTTFCGHIWRFQYSNSFFTRKNFLQWLRNFVLQLFANYGRICGKNRFAEKTPSHAKTMDLIKETFPDAQFIHMIRNGYDVCRSLRDMPWAANEIEPNVQHWMKSVQTARAFGSQCSADDYLEIRLEDLIENFDDQVKRLCFFLGEDFAPSMIEFYKPENNSWNKTLSLPSNHYSSKRKELDPAEKELFWSLAGYLMRELEYEPTKVRR